MSYYIEQSEALEKVRSLVDSMSVCTNKDTQRGMRNMKNRALTVLSLIPAADVRENVRGKWLNYNDNEKMCSNCKTRQLWMNAAVYQYCPHCGADMRNEDRKEQRNNFHKSSWKDNGNETISCPYCDTYFPKEREPYMHYCGYCGRKIEVKTNE